MQHFLANGLFLDFIGQATTMGLALEAGLREDQIVCDSHAFPPDQSEVAMVAADDVLFFHRSKTVVSQRLGQFDEAVKRAQVPKAAHKDVDLASELVGLGCRISNVPCGVGPDRRKLWTLILGNHRAVRRTPGQSGSQFYAGAGPVVLHLIAAAFRLLQSSYRLARVEPTDVIRAAAWLLCRTLRDQG